MTVRRARRRRDCARGWLLRALYVAPTFTIALRGGSVQRASTSTRTPFRAMYVRNRRGTQARMVRAEGSCRPRPVRCDANPERTIGPRY
jgi:hypothetical protein